MKFTVYVRSYNKCRAEIAAFHPIKLKRRKYRACNVKFVPQLMIIFITSASLPWFMLYLSFCLLSLEEKAEPLTLSATPGQM